MFPNQNNLSIDRFSMDSFRFLDGKRRAPRHGTGWTPADDAELRRYWDAENIDVAIRAAAAVLGRSTVSVQARLKKIGLLDDDGILSINDRISE